jgi:hypothetical protein
MKRTCGNCTHSDNNLGIVALHCDLIAGTEYESGEYNDGKVRSWQKCELNPEKFNPRAKGKENKQMIILIHPTQDKIVEAKK